MPELDELVPEKAVEVYEADLDALLDTLTTVYHYCITSDLTRQYANLRNKVDPSPLTKQVDRMRRKVKAILDEWKADQDVAEQQPVQ